MDIEIVNMLYRTSITKLKGESAYLQNVENNYLKRCRVITNSNKLGVSYGEPFCEDELALSIQALKNAQLIVSNNFNSERLFYSDSTNIQNSKDIGPCKIRVIYDKKITFERKVNGNIINKSEILRRMYGYTMGDSKYIHFFLKGNEQVSFSEEINPDHIVKDSSLIESCILTPNAVLNFLYPYILSMLKSSKLSNSNILSENFNVVSRGSSSFDTEGCRLQGGVLIENGTIKNRISSFVFKKEQDYVGFYGYHGLYLRNIDLIFPRNLLNEARFLFVCAIEPVDNSDVFLLRCIDSFYVSVNVCVRLISIKKFLANCYSLGDLFYGRSDCRCSYCLLANFYEIFDVLN